MMLQWEDFVFEASWPRATPRATSRSTDVLECLARRYSLQPRQSSNIRVPLSRTHRRINIILAHANGFPKELYEPFICHLLSIASEIDAVYIHDVVGQGYSGARNAKKLGNEYSWFDSGRDILKMVGHARTTGMLENGPLIGIGHSMGACQVMVASHFHSSLFESCIAIDPIIEEFSTLEKKAGSNVALLSMRRRDHWPSREDAREKFSKSPFYRAWDKAVFDRMIEHGLTRISNDPANTEVMLTTTVAQEVFSFLHARPHRGMEDSNPDCSTFVYKSLPLYNHPVHFIFGEDSTTVPPEARERLTKRIKRGTRHDIRKGTHLVPMELPNLTAKTCADIVSRAYKSWQERDQEDASIKRPSVITRELREALMSEQAAADEMRKKSKAQL